jgi:hypothetical protein
VGPTAGLEAVEKRKFFPHLNSNSDPSVIQPVTSRYSDWATDSQKSRRTYGNSTEHDLCSFETFSLQQIERVTLEVRRHVNCRLLSDFYQNWNVLADLSRNLAIKIFMKIRNFGSSPIVTLEQTEIAKLTGALYSFSLRACQQYSSYVIENKFALFKTM